MTMNLIGLKDYLKDKDKLEELLNHIGMYKIKYNHKANEIRFTDNEDGNPTAIRINLNTLGYVDFRNSIKGDLFTFIQEYNNCNFKNSINFIKNYFKLDNISYNKNTKLPFKGFYKNLLTTNIEHSELKTYPENILNHYSNHPNLKFFNDKITFKTQQEFNLGYDVESLRITIPWRNEMGDIVGIIGRCNSEQYDENGVSKYLPVISFPKNQVLFGMYNNYNYLIGKTVIIVEAEKSVMIAKSLNINNVVAIGGHSLSHTHVNLIKSLYPKNIIICYDEGIEKDDIVAECDKLKSSSNILKYKIGYFNNEILPKDSKISVFDTNTNIKTLIKNNISWR